MIPAPPHTATDRFAFILDALCRAVAARGADKRGCGGLGAGPVLVLLWTRLQRMATRFAALAARVGAGAPPAPARRRAAARPASPPPLRLPRGFGWLLRLAPETACHGSQLRHLLADPEFSALVSGAPALGRVLRPLCQMLGIEMLSIQPPSSLTPPSRTAGVEADAAPRTTPRARLPAWPASPSRSADASRLAPGLRPISGD